MWNFKQSIYKTTRAVIDPCPGCTESDITIGTQIWKKCNAAIEFYNNGDPIDYVPDPIAWSALTTGAWCYVNDDPLTDRGKLYNWYAITDSRGFAPSGYHVPTDTEWNTLATYLGGTSVAGGKMKEVGVCHWSSPNTDATNISGFTAFGGGLRNASGIIFNADVSSAFWSSTPYSSNSANDFNLYYADGTLNPSQSSKKYGETVRFIKD